MPGDIEKASDNENLVGFNGELKRADDIGRRLGSFADFTANSILGEIEPEEGGGRSE